MSLPGAKPRAQGPLHAQGLVSLGKKLEPNAGPVGPGGTWVAAPSPPPSHQPLGSGSTIIRFPASRDGSLILLKGAETPGTGPDVHGDHSYHSASGW